MKEYPKIYHYNKATFNENIIAFNKLDGSNIRTEWILKHSKLNKNNGFNKFGTRKTIIDENHKEFSEAVNIFLNKYSEQFDRIFRTNKYFRNINKMTLFFEFYGENSFAGRHFKEDVKDISVFDIFIDKRDFIIAKDFIKIFSNLNIPEIVYTGNFNKKLIEDIKENKYNLKEGVVCKGFKKEKGIYKQWSVKIKTLDWLNKLKSQYGDNAVREELNNELNLY